MFDSVCFWVCLVIVLAIMIALAISDRDFITMYMEKFGKSVDHLAGQVVWITGGSSGIGEYVAYDLARAGCKLVLSARREKELERVKAACVSFGQGKISEADVLVLPLDVKKFDTHQEAVEKVIAHFKQIDILFNNAGQSQRAMWTEVDLEVDRQLFELNVFGQVSLTQSVLPHMIGRKKGNIAVVSSASGKLGTPGGRSYVGSKHALHGYFESLRSEMGEHNINVTMICPGYVTTPIVSKSIRGKPNELVGDVKVSENRMTVERCAFLCGVALANSLQETWISKQPALLLLYIQQYCPSLARRILMTAGLKYIRKNRHLKD